MGPRTASLISQYVLFPKTDSNVPLDSSFLYLFYSNYEKHALRVSHSYRGARQIFMQALDFPRYSRKKACKPTSLELRHRLHALFIRLFYSTLTKISKDILYKKRKLFTIHFDAINSCLILFRYSIKQCLIF